jgi:hypothetical protein
LRFGWDNQQNSLVWTTNKIPEKVNYFGKRERTTLGGGFPADGSAFTLSHNYSAYGVLAIFNST